MLGYYTRSTTNGSQPGSFSIEDFEKAGMRVAERRYGRHDLIFAPGDPDDHFYFLVEGTVRLYKIYGHCKEATTGLLKDAGVFGRLSLDEGRGQEVFAEATTGTRVLAARKNVVVGAAERYPELAVRLFAAFAERLEQSEEVIEHLLDREVSVRLARLLSNLGDRFGEPNGTGTVVEVRLTHQDLANMVASSREAVSKVMGDFQRAGLIEARKWRITISPQLSRMYG